jgi:hypothetical protein
MQLCMKNTYYVCFLRNRLAKFTIHNPNNLTIEFPWIKRLIKILVLILYYLTTHSRIFNSWWQRAAAFRPLFGAYNYQAWRDLYRVTSAVTWDLGSLSCHPCCDMGPRISIVPHLLWHGNLDLYSSTPAVARDLGLYSSTPAVTQDLRPLLCHTCHDTWPQIFIVLHLPWHGTSDFYRVTPAVTRDLRYLSCYTCCDTGPRIFFVSLLL